MWPDCNGETVASGIESLFKKFGWKSEDVLMKGFVLFHFVFKIKEFEYIYMLMRSQ